LENVEKMKVKLAVSRMLDVASPRPLCVCMPKQPPDWNSFPGIWK
jgi:hypothetical protein